MEDLKNGLKKLDLAPFKVREIYRYINKKMVTDIDDIVVLSKEERERLKSKYYISQLRILETQKSHDVRKVTFELEDGLVIESVLMKYKGDHTTVCVSCQVGCPIGCSFCATGQMGFTRNLSVAEILSQVYHFAKEEKVSNVVFMGMGEPFFNYDNVLAAAKILNNGAGLHLGNRKIIISTIGVISGIKKLTQEPHQFRLAWSLVAPSDEVRETLIGWEGLPTIKEIISVLIDYQKKTKRRVTIEYVVLKGLNDGKEEIKALADISHRIDSHINLIPYNSSKDALFESGNVDQAFNQLKKLKVNVTVRRSLGQKIAAACGQLASKAS